MRAATVVEHWPMTTDEFETWCLAQPDAKFIEFVNGSVVVNPPAGYPHGSVEIDLGAMVHAHVKRHRLGKVFGPSQGFVFPTGDSLGPDCSFIARDRWEAFTPIPGKFLRIVPDFVAEVLSRKTKDRDRHEKKSIYARSGVREYWLVDPSARTVTAYELVGKRYGRAKTARLGDTLRSTVIDGLVVRVADVFE